TPWSNGNYVVSSGVWNGSRGAVTWGNGSTGVSGTVSDVNSLAGSGYIVVLRNANYLVVNSGWNEDRGAVTWGDGNTGVSGPVSDANSLVGGNPRGGVGNFGITLLTNGNYAVRTVGWDGGRGRVTWGDRSTGVRGIVLAANSLRGEPGG